MISTLTVGVPVGAAVRNRHFCSTRQRHRPTTSQSGTERPSRRQDPCREAGSNERKPIKIDDHVCSESFEMAHSAGPGAQTILLRARELPPQLQADFRTVRPLPVGNDLRHVSELSEPVEI